MAALWKLPVLYIFENNKYGIGTVAGARPPPASFTIRGEGYGIPGKAVDGMDVWRCRAAAAEALDYVRRARPDDP